MNRDLIQALPKVELHCHLDGSVSMQALREISGKDEIAGRITAPVPCSSLKEYLTCFDVILPYLQTPRALEIAALDVVRQAAADRVRYLEVRFAPGFHCREGMTEAEACHAVLRGLERGEAQFGVKSRMLLCMMRGLDHDFNLRTLHCAREIQGYGLAGLDLAGNEAAYPPELYRDLFDMARSWDIPFTIHAGECGSSENVRRSVEMGARRIGHGVAIAEDAEIKELCRKNGVCLEMCPVSNLQTKAVRAIGRYPFLRLQREGLRATIHTDNRTVSGTTLTGEWMLLCEHFPQIDEAVIRQANRDAARSAFLSEPEIRQLLKEL